MKDLFNKISSLEAQYLDLLEELCNIESPTADKERVDAAVSCLTELAKKRGWVTEICRQNVAGSPACITLNPDADNAPICFSAHLDTVHPVGSFGSPAVRRDGTNMYGPGVMDCKGGAVAAFMAMDALEQCGFTNRPIKLILQTDEETGSSTSGKDTLRFMCEKAKDAVAFINLEGHVKGTAVIERKGILRYRFNVSGKALHSARCYDAANAVAESAHKIIELEKMKDPKGLTCNCGVISGGTTPNTVAEKCWFSADIRFSDQAQCDEAMSILKNVADTSYVEGCSCELSKISFRPSMPLTDRNAALLSKINEIFVKNGLPTLSARPCHSGSDAAYITEIGVPCVDCLGTAGGNIHSINEYITLDSLAASARMLAVIAFGI